MPWEAAQVARPSLVKLNRELAEELGLDAGALDSAAGARIFVGNETPEGAVPVAQAYAGHQFGGFVPQLGDGRALAAGRGDRPQRHVVATFSSRARGARRSRAAATAGRSLADAARISGRRSRCTRSGSRRPGRWPSWPRASRSIVRARCRARCLTRVAASHIRVGTFQLFAARGERGAGARLADHAIDRHYRGS